MNTKELKEYNLKIANLSTEKQSLVTRLVDFLSDEDFFMLHNAFQHPTAKGMPLIYFAIQYFDDLCFESRPTPLNSDDINDLYFDTRKKFGKRVDSVIRNNILTRDMCDTFAEAIKNRFTLSNSFFIKTVVSSFDINKILFSLNIINSNVMYCLTEFQKIHPDYNYFDSAHTAKAPLFFDFVAKDFGIDIERLVKCLSPFNFSFDEFDQNSLGTLRDLPFEVIEHILFYCDTDCLSQVQKCSKSLNILSNKDSMWKKKFERDFSKICCERHKQFTDKTFYLFNELTWSHFSRLTEIQNESPKLHMCVSSGISSDESDNDLLDNLEFSDSDTDDPL